MYFTAKMMLLWIFLDMPLGHICTSFCYVSVYGEAYETHMLNFSFIYLPASLVTQMVKNPPVKQETQVWFLGWEDPLKEGLATRSGILAWRIPMNREAWQATVHGVAKSQTRLSNLPTSSI